MKRTVAVTACVLGVAAGAAVLAHKSAAPAAASASGSAFTEIKWPFLMDQWGLGRAFHCAAAACGADVEVYVRAKIGFCNCTTGVSDDNELDRLTDFSLMGEKPNVLGPGHPIDIAWMKGRIRSYAISNFYRPPNSALAIAFNDHCDAVVATVVVPRDSPAAIEPSVVAFLNSKTIINWTEVALGL